MDSLSNEVLKLFFTHSPTFKKENATQKNDAFIKSSKEFEENGSKIL